jgi:hypothetical protein
VRSRDVLYLVIESLMLKKREFESEEEEGGTREGL